MFKGVAETIADGKKIRVGETGSVRFTGIENKCIRMVDVHQIGELYWRLLSVGKLAERELNIEFEHTSCVFWDKNHAIASMRMISK